MKEPTYEEFQNFNLFKRVRWINKWHRQLNKCEDAKEFFERQLIKEEKQIKELKAKILKYSRREGLPVTKTTKKNLATGK